jgi:hypothetical protein
MSADAIKKFSEATIALLEGDKIKAGKMAFDAIAGFIEFEVIKAWLTDLDMQNVDKLVDKEESDKLKG